LDLAQALASASATPGGERCDAMVGSQLGSATIERAETIHRGAYLIGIGRRVIARIMFGPLPDLSVQADFCRVKAKLRPVAGSEITVEVWLPEHWNDKLVAVGGGGFNGGLGSVPLTLWAPLTQGYAGVATDAGHEETESARFAHDSHQQFIDYAYQGNHVAVGFAKELVAAYYVREPRRAYFVGCSNGGRDALIAARRFPADFDGIIAGAPAASWSGLMTSFAWNALASRRAPGLDKKLKLVQDAALAKCDMLDGVQDQVVENPMTCPFKPEALQCAGSAGSDCLTAEEVAAFRKIYDGPALADGTRIYAGMPAGGEALPNNWENWIVGKKSTQAVMAQETFRWMVHHDGDWTLERFDLESDYPKARDALRTIMDADDPDLRTFTGRGGKLLMYHGWNDAAIPAGATIDYFDRLRAFQGPTSDSQIRLFMVPGMMHCLGGVGPTDFNMLAPLDAWVEAGTVPERIVAAQYDPPAVFAPTPGAKIMRTRPLCPWPRTAHYNGTGSTDEAANFTCK
jgi:feruloyl esterase